MTHEAIGVGTIPNEDELLEVMQFSKFASLDGVDWNDPKAKEKLYVGTAIIDYIERSKNRRDFEPVKKEKISRVRGSSALKMWDNNLRNFLLEIQPRILILTYHSNRSTKHSPATQKNTSLPYFLPKNPVISL